MVTGIPVMKAGKLFKRCLEDVEQERGWSLMSLGRNMIDICDFVSKELTLLFKSESQFHCRGKSHCHWVELDEKSFSEGALPSPSQDIRCSLPRILILSIKAERTEAKELTHPL